MPSYAGHSQFLTSVTSHFLLDFKSNLSLHFSDANDHASISPPKAFAFGVPSLALRTEYPTCQAIFRSEQGAMDGYLRR